MRSILRALGIGGGVNSSPMTQALPLDTATNPMGFGVITVTPINNGYVVSTMKKAGSSHGLEVRASFASDLDGVKELIARETAQLRFDF